MSEQNLPSHLLLAVDAWFAQNTGLGGCSDKDVSELAAIFYGVTHEGGRESADDALAVVASFGPGIEGLNDTYARQVLLAQEVLRLRATAPAPVNAGSEGELLENIESPFNACMHREHCIGWKRAANASPSREQPTAEQPSREAEEDAEIDALFREFDVDADTAIAAVHMQFFHRGVAFAQRAKLNAKAPPQQAAQSRELAGKDALDADRYRHLIATYIPGTPEDEWDELDEVLSLGNKDRVDALLDMSIASRATQEKQ